MLTIRELIKTLYNALKQNFKNYRGNWDQNDPTADDYIKNRPFYTDESGKVIKIDKKFIDLPNNIVTEDDLATVATSGSYNDLSSKPTIYTEVVRYDTTQSLTDVQKTQARTNIGAVSSDEITGVVKYNVAQSLTDIEKQQARTNIGATDADETKAAIDDLSRLMSEPKDGIAFTDQVNGYTYIACMRNGNFVTHIGVKSIEVTTMPTKTEYMVGEYFDPTGMIVTATTYDGITKEVTDFTCPSSYIVEGDTFVEITYIEGGITHIATIPITVTPFDPATVLVDFEYTAHVGGTYTITDWKGTSNGEASTEIIIPNNGLIVV